MTEQIKKTKDYYGYILVTAAFFSMVVIWAAYYAFGVFLKPLLLEFGWTRAMTSGAFSLSSVMMGLLGIAMGGLNDRFGPRIVMSFCGVSLGIAYLLMSQLHALWQFYLFFGVILGIGMGGSFVPLVTTIARWFEKRRGIMTGIVTAGIGIGAMIGPPVANWLISGYGWRMSYMALGFTTFLVIIPSAQLLKRDAVKVEKVGSRDLSEDRSGRNPETVRVSFREALEQRQFWVLFASVFCFGYSVFSIMVHIAAHAMEMGISPARAANILATIGGGSIVGKVLGGRAIDIFGSQKIFVIGFLLMSAALVWLVPARTALMIFLFAGFFGLAYGGCVVVESPIVAVLFGLHSHGSILGVISAAFTFGGAFGPWMTGYLFDISSSYHSAFLGCVMVSVVGLLLAIALNTKKTGRKDFL